MLYILQLSLALCGIYHYINPLWRFYKLHERKCEPIIMTVPRKVSLGLDQVVNMLFLQRCFIEHLLSAYCPALLSSWHFPPPVRSVPGRPVSRHGRPRSRSGGRGVVRREKRRPHPDLAQRRLRLHEEPGSESGQDERPGDQASHKSRKHPDCPEACFSTALSSECECINVSYFPVCSLLSLL